MMKNTNDYMNIPREKFKMVNEGQRLTDKKFDDKPVGYLKDAWIRFRKNKGSIVQLEKNKAKGKCRKWRLMVSLGKDPLTGKYPMKTRVVHGTWSEAQKALREFVEELEGGTVISKTSWTFEGYLAHFVEVALAFEPA